MTCHYQRCAKNRVTDHAAIVSDDHREHDTPIEVQRGTAYIQVSQVEEIPAAARSGDVLELVQEHGFDVPDEQRCAVLPQYPLATLRPAAPPCGCVESLCFSFP
jgi:hypothetical protein